MLNLPPFENHAQYIKGFWSPIPFMGERGGFTPQSNSPKPVECSTTQLILTRSTLESISFRVVRVQSHKTASPTHPATSDACLKPRLSPVLLTQIQDFHDPLPVFG